MKIFHISDLHLSPFDKKGEDNVDKVLADIKKYAIHGDLLVVTGDILNRDATDYAPAFDKIKSLNLPFFCITGNHDSSSALTLALQKLYPSHPKPQTHKLDYVCNDFPFTIIALDSYKDNTPGGELDEAQLAWLKKELETADKPIVILLHQFCLDAGLDFFDKKTCRPWRNQFINLVKPFEHKIKLILSGHLHNSLVGHIGSIPIISAFSANWQADFDFAPINNLKNVSRPVGYYIHRFENGNFISYAAIV